MIRIAAFPKAYLDALVNGTMDWVTWIEMAATLGVDGLELYQTALSPGNTKSIREIWHTAQSVGLEIPMMCSSPDFTHPDQDFRSREIERMRRIIDVMAEIGPTDFRSCRVLSGQRRPGITREDGVRWTVDCIGQLLPYAADLRVHLVMENHYKDGFWEYPEFAQASDVFFEIVEQIQSPWFGINFDPSNAIVAGEDPLVILARALPHVKTMHASDRQLASGYTLDDMKQFTGSGYSQGLVHGVIGEGLNDYDTIFNRLQEVSFSGWISIEDGVNGLDEMKASAEYLREKVAKYERKFHADSPH